MIAYSFGQCLAVESIEQRVDATLEVVGETLLLRLQANGQRNILHMQMTTLTGVVCLTMSSCCEMTLKTGLKLSGM